MIKLPTQEASVDNLVGPTAYGAEFNVLSTTLKDGGLYLVAFNMRMMNGGSFGSPSQFGYLVIRFTDAGIAHDPIFQTLAPIYNAVPGFSGTFVVHADAGSTLSIGQVCTNDNNDASSVGNVSYSASVIRLL